MGWNLEVAAVRSDSIADAVPDVFTETETVMGFEEATSVWREMDMCAGQVGEWVFVIDTACRLSGADSHLSETSASTDLHVVRIADDPLALHYHHGNLVSQARGLDACLRLAPRADADGELCAMDLLALETGVMFHKDLWDVGFTRFEL